MSPDYEPDYDTDHDTGGTSTDYKYRERYPCDWIDLACGQFQSMSCKIRL